MSKIDEEMERPLRRLTKVSTLTMASRKELPCRRSPDACSQPGRCGSGASSPRSVRTVVMPALSAVPCMHLPAWGIPAPPGHLLPLATAAPVAGWRGRRTLATAASPQAPSSSPRLCFDSGVGEEV